MSEHCRDSSPSQNPSPITPSIIGFKYVWPVKVSLRPVADDDSIILHVSPKFATVHDHVSFQWSLKIHGTAGRMPSDDELDEDPTVNLSHYIAAQLYYVDGPVNQIQLQAIVGVINKDGEKALVEEKIDLKMQRGRSCELTYSDRAQLSEHIKANVGNVIRVAVLLQFDTKLFDPFTYLDTVSPTPAESFLTTNYRARVNSKVWRRRSKKFFRKDSGKIPREQKIDYEERFRRVLERETHTPMSTATVEEKSEHRHSIVTLRRSSAVSTITLLEQLNQPPDHEHLFKKILISCCDSCERRRASLIDDTKTEDSDDDIDADDEEDDEDDEDKDSFECIAQDKEHVHDLLARMYFNNVVLPEMEYVEDFVDFLIDAELNDLPVLKRACARYLCGELNTKKDLLTSLLLDLLFLAIVFNLAVLKSMTLSELSTRMDELANPEKLMEEEEYKNLDKRIRTLSDRNLVELIEQCQVFREQRARVTTVLL